MKKPELAPNVRNFTAHFNIVAACVSSSILAITALSDRTKMILFWIKVLEHLRVLRNYESTLAVVAGLTSTPINRLKVFSCFFSFCFLTFCARTRGRRCRLKLWPFSRTAAI